MDGMSLNRQDAKFAKYRFCCQRFTVKFARFAKEENGSASIFGKLGALGVLAVKIFKPTQREARELRDRRGGT